MRKIVSVFMLVFALVLGGCGGMAGIESLDLMEEADQPPAVVYTQFFAGHGVPTDVGAVNDTYVDLDTGILYQKSADGWAEIGSLRGADGATGAIGPAGENGADGTDGTDGVDGVSWKPLTGYGEPGDLTGQPGDVYIDLTNLNFYVWNGEGWGSPFSLQGATGEQGEQGEQGEPGPIAIKPPMFVVADADAFQKVRLSWTASEGASYYLVYAMKYDDATNTISALRVWKGTSLIAVFDTVVNVPEPPIPAPLSPVVFGDSAKLTYVVTAVDSTNHESAGSYAVGPLTSNPH